MQLLEAREVKNYNAYFRIPLSATMLEAAHRWFSMILVLNILIMSLPLLFLWWEIEGDFSDCFAVPCGCHLLRNPQRDLTALLSLCTTWECDFWGTAKPSTQQHFSRRWYIWPQTHFDAFIKSWLLNDNVSPCTCSILEGFNGFFTKVLCKVGEQVWVCNHWASPPSAVAWVG